jgi:hypothetical protein
MSSIKEIMQRFLDNLQLFTTEQKDMIEKAKADIDDPKVEFDLKDQEILSKIGREFDAFFSTHNVGREIMSKEENMDTSREFVGELYETVTNAKKRKRELDDLPSSSKKRKRELDDSPSPPKKQNF